LFNTIPEAIDRIVEESAAKFEPTREPHTGERSQRMRRKASRRRRAFIRIFLNCRRNLFAKRLALEVQTRKERPSEVQTPSGRNWTAAAAPPGALFTFLTENPGNPPQ
jgi:hypothetical protein